MSQLNLTGFSIDASGNVSAGRVTSTAGRVRSVATKTANYTAVAGDELIAYTALAAARTVTLPAANSVPAGYELIVQDWAGAAGTNNITVQRAGSDTVDGGTSVAIATDYGAATFVSNGSNAWFAR